MQITHDALNAPLPILRAMYELQMKRTDSFFLEVQKRSATISMLKFVFTLFIQSIIEKVTFSNLMPPLAHVLCLLCYVQIRWRRDKNR